MDGTAAELLELRRRRVTSALTECRDYESQLKSSLEYIEKQLNSKAPIDSESSKARRLAFESSVSGYPILSKLFEHESDCKIVEAPVAELQRQVEQQRQEIAELKQQSGATASGSDEFKSIVSDLFQEKRPSIFSAASGLPLVSPSSCKTLREDSTNDKQSDHQITVNQPSVEDVFDYISTRMLRGTLTKTMFVRFLSLNNNQNKVGVSRQLFRVLRLYQKIVSISQDLGRQTETRAALMKIEDVTYDILDAELVNIYTFDKKKNTIECLGSDRPSRKGFSIKAGEGSVGRIAQKPEIKRLRFVDNDPNLSELLPCEYGAVKVRSMIVVPIMDDAAQSLLGFVQCFNKRGDSFSLADEEILKQITRQAAIILVTTLKFQEEKKRQERNEAIMEIVKTVHTNEDVDQIISKVVEASYRVVRCDRVSLFMIDPSTNELWFKISKDAEATGFRFPVGKGISGFVAASGQSLNIVDAYKDERFSAALDKQSNYLTKTVLCVPVSNFRGKPVAVIQCINKHCALCDRVPCVDHQVQFEDSDLDIMQTFAREIASALQRKAQESSFQQAMDMSGNKSHMKDYISQFINGQARRQINSRSDAIEWPLSSSQATQSELCDWNFDVFSHSLDELLGLCENIYDILELTQSFRIPRSTLRNFLFQLRSMYFDNPYHNFRHAFSVMHMCFLFITTTSAKTILTGADILALITAALGHDLGHPGMNNDFLINSEDELSIRYNDVSVLENHHAATLCQLLRKQETDILSGLSKQDRQILRKSIVEGILHTDMSQHKTMLEALINRSNASMKLNRNNPFDRQLMVNNILHCSDIGNPVLPIQLSVRWADLIQQEFYQQAKREKEMNLPYAAFMLNTSRESLANLQINFINYVVRPIWKAMNDFLPELSFAMDNMDANRNNWEAIAREYQDNK